MLTFVSIPAETHIGKVLLIAIDSTESECEPN